MFSSTKGCIIIVALAMIVVLVQGQSLTPNRLVSKYLDFCQERTGLKYKEMREANTRNEGCTIDCVTNMGLLHSFNYQEKEPCGDRKDYTCRLGKCVPKGELEYDDLNEVQISIKSARVPDLDPSPGQGESDAFVAITVERNGEPSYPDNELVSHTYVVQDNPNPKWNFSFRPSPLRSGAQLRFDVFDSDKPLLNPDVVGSGRIELSEALNKGIKRLELYKDNRKLPDTYYLEVEITGSSYHARA